MALGMKLIEDYGVAVESVFGAGFCADGFVKTALVLDGITQNLTSVCQVLVVVYHLLRDAENDVGLVAVARRRDDFCTRFTIREQHIKSNRSR